MTPDEEERLGLTERFRREEEQRKKEVARHLPSFAKLQPMLASIKDDQEPTVFEGLPHQVFYGSAWANLCTGLSGSTSTTPTRAAFALR